MSIVPSGPRESSVWRQPGERKRAINSGDGHPVYGRNCRSRLIRRRIKAMTIGKRLPIVLAKARRFPLSRFRRKSNRPFRAGETDQVPLYSYVSLSSRTFLF